MNDFQAGRDITIKDSKITVNSTSNEIKPIGLLTTPELFEEKKHREQLCHEEKQRRTKHLPKLISFSCCCLIIVLGLQKFTDPSNPVFLTISVLSSIASMGSFWIAGKAWTEKFELRQLEVLKEINMILRERRAL
jgi:hypothetical protein